MFSRLKTRASRRSRWPAGCRGRHQRSRKELIGLSRRSQHKDVITATRARGHNRPPRYPLESPPVLFDGIYDGIFSRSRRINILISGSYGFNVSDAAPPITTPNCVCSWAFFLKSRVPARVREDSCGLRARARTPENARFHSLRAIPRSGLALLEWPEVRKGPTFWPYKSMRYARTNQAVDFAHR